MSSFLAEQFAELLADLAKIKVTGEYRPPRCACNGDLIVWHGRHTGRWFIIHPRISPIDCPRSAFRMWGDTPEQAMRNYLEKAPDLGALDESPEATTNPADLEFEP